MSTYALVAAWDAPLEKQPGCSLAAQRLVLLALSDDARRDGTGIRLAVSQAVAMTGLTRRTVQAVFRALVSQDVLRADRPATPRRAAEYRFGPWYAATREGGRGALTAPLGGNGRTPRGATIAHSPGFPVSSLNDARSRSKTLDDVERESAAAAEEARRLFPEKFATPKKRVRKRAPA